MQITDHDTHHLGKRAGFRFWVQFGEDYAYINFADFTSYLVAAGEFDGYNDSTDDGEIWRYTDRDLGRCESYTFNEVIKDFMLTGDLDHYLHDYIRLKMVIEDFVLESAA